MRNIENKLQKWEMKTAHGAKSRNWDENEKMNRRNIVGPPREKSK